jgi:hypothetical protein
MNKLRATVSGSFRRHMAAVQEAVYALTDAGAEVLSPADPRVVDSFGEFLFVASDRLRTVRVVQSRHLAAIKASDLLWLVTPDGYVGPSAAMELGVAMMGGVPVYCDTPPDDLTMRQFVAVVSNVSEALTKVRLGATGQDHYAGPGVLLDPDQAVEEGHAHLEAIRRMLLQVDGVHREDMPNIARVANALRQTVQGL